MTTYDRLPDNVQQHVDRHLDEIDNVLRADGLSRHERATVVDEVEAQVRDMLAARAGATPSLADAEAVIGGLDPPEAYAGERAARGAQGPGHPRGSAPPAGPARLSGLARVSAMFGGLAMFLAALALTFHTWSPRWLGFGFGVVTGAISVLAWSGAIGGLVALVQILRSRGQLRGATYAVIGMVSVPAVMLLKTMALVGFLTGLDLNSPTGTLWIGTPNPLGPIVLLAVLLACVLVAGRAWAGDRMGGTSRGVRIQ